MLMTRRKFIKWAGTMAVGGLAAGTYGVMIEPRIRLNTTVYAFTPPKWTLGLKLRAVMLADPHLINPLMPISRWQHIIDTANALQPDIIFLMGDYLASHHFSSSRVTFEEVAKAAKSLSAPLGIVTILGNHDWWEDREVQRTGKGTPLAQKIFEDHGFPVLHNSGQRLLKSGQPFWVTSTASIVAIRKGRRHFEGRDDLPTALATVTDDAPIIHLAHEPDLFVDVPDRVSLTLSGHTHGGQVRAFGYSPVVPSQFGNRFAYGHVVENGRNLVVSGGLGCSLLPIRIGSPPEITVLELG